MRRFKYRLERLLRYRRSLTNRERISLAQAVGVLTRAEDHASDMRGVRNETLLLRIRALETGLTAKEMENLHHHVLRIDEAIDQAEDDIEKAREDMEDARGKLVERRRDERAIELHRDRRFKAWLKDYYRDEGRTLDDLATIRHVRREESGD
jgi:flagellar FliJ protein